MTTFSPLAVRLVRPEWADRVPSPAHDALTPAERRTFLAANPESYLTVTRSPEDVDLTADEAIDPHQLLVEGRRALDRLLASGVFTEPHPPRFYVYELVADGHRQTGLVGGIALDDYRNSELKVHEQVQVDRTEHLAEHLGVVKAQSSPLAVAHRPHSDISRVLADATGGDPLVLAVGDDGLTQRVWAVDDVEATNVVTSVLAEQPTYLVDGHHRAAAARLFDDRVQTADSGQILVAAFASDQLLNRAFHRVIVGRTLDELRATIGDRLRLRPVDAGDAALAGRASDEIVITDGQQWLALTLPRRGGTDAASLLADLDPVRLEHQLLAGMLDIEATAGEDHLRYRPGNTDIRAIARDVGAEGGVLCVSRPVPVDVVMEAADAGLVMPPKSTYFEPKVRSGVFVRSIC